MSDYINNCLCYKPMFNCHVGRNINLKEARQRIEPAKISGVTDTGIQEASLVSGVSDTGNQQNFDAQHEVV